MKRLFFSVLALTLGAFVFWSCDKEEEIDNGKGKPAERGSYMTVQQQRDAFQDNINGIAQAIDFTDLSEAASIVADVVGKKWNMMSAMPILTDSALVYDPVFMAKMQYAMMLYSGLQGGQYDSLALYLDTLYMSADVHVVDTIIYNDTIAAVTIDSVNYESDCLLLNVFVDDHIVILRAKADPGESTIEYVDSLNHTTIIAVPEIVEISIKLDGEVLADLKGEYKSDFKVSIIGEDPAVIDGSSMTAKANLKVAGYELDGNFSFATATGVKAKLTAKYSGTELLSINGNVDANLEGIDMADTAQVLAWVQNPEKLKAISLGASVRGGKIVFKLNAENPFKDEELARILRSQMMPGAKLTEEQEAKMVERINEVVDGGFYFEGFKEPQAKLKFVYREIADKAKPITENEKITGVVGADVIDAISEVFFKGGAYTMLTVRDDEGYEKDIQLEEYFSGISVETLTQTVIQKALEAFGPVIAQFAGDEGQEK